MIARLQFPDGVAELDDDYSWTGVNAAVLNLLTELLLRERSAADGFIPLYLWHHIRQHTGDDVPGELLWTMPEPQPGVVY